jgi:hypothetical protein
MAMKHGRLLFSTMKEQATKIRSRLLLMLLLAKHATKVNKEILTSKITLLYTRKHTLISRHMVKQYQRQEKDS